MNGLEHYAEAERCLDLAENQARGGHDHSEAMALANAQVHATLAVVWAHNRATTELTGVLHTLLDQIRELREAQS